MGSLRLSNFKAVKSGSPSLATMLRSYCQPCGDRGVLFHATSPAHGLVPPILRSRISGHLVIKVDSGYGRLRYIGGRNSRTALYSSLSVFKTRSHILPLWNLSPSAPKIEEALMVAIKQGGTAEAAISGVIETIDSEINRSLFLVADWCPWGGLVKEQ